MRTDRTVNRWLCVAALVLGLPPAALAQQAATPLPPYRTVEVPWADGIVGSELHPFSGEEANGWLLEDPGRPPLSGDRIIKEVALGFGAGLGGAVGGSLLALGYVLVDYLAGDDQYADIDQALQVFGYTGYVIGSAAGVYWIGNTEEETGSFWATLAGSAIGFGSPGAAVGFNLTRRYREAPAESALVNVSGGTLHLAIPMISVATDRLQPGRVNGDVVLFSASTR